MQTGFRRASLYQADRGERIGRTVTSTRERQLVMNSICQKGRKGAKEAITQWKNKKETMTEIRGTGNVGWTDLMSECQKSENCRPKE